MITLVKEIEIEKAKKINEKKFVKDFADQEKRELKNLEFWDKLAVEKNIFTKNKEIELKKQISEIRSKKVSLEKINPESKDVLSATLFFSTLFIMASLNVSMYSLYLILPLSAYTLGRYVFPKKVKIIDQKRASKIEANMKDLIEEDFLKEIASKELLSAYKETYGKESLEDVFIESIKEQKIMMLNKPNEKIEYEYQIKIKDLINQAKLEEENKNEKTNIKKILEIF